MWTSFCRLFSPADSQPDDTSGMGNTSKKLAAKCALLTKEEQKQMAATFRAASRGNDNIREEDLIVSGKLDAVLLEKLWGPQIDPRLAQYLSNYLFGFGAHKQPVCDFNRFAELYVRNIRGTVDEKLAVVYSSLGMAEGVEVPYQLLREYCESIVSTYIRMVKTSKHENPSKWIEKGFRGKASHVQALGEAVAVTASKDPDTPDNTIDPDQINRWLFSHILLQGMAELVFENLYGMNEERDRAPSEPGHSAVNPTSLFPAPIGIDPLPDYPAFIDISHIAFLNSNLPRKYQSKWRFLFSSHIHGESFSTMAGRIQDVGPSLVIIEDNSGYIFGGYAPVSWKLAPDFYGSEESFLFSLAPKMRVYPATSYNNHFQYMNYQTKTLPNGLMMGGQFEFGGIWVNADPFGTGSSAETCISYRGFKRLSKEPTFKIRSLEVWGVGEKPLSVKESMESVASRRSSVLDTHASDRKFLQVCGKQQISDGLR